MSIRRDLKHSNWQVRGDPDPKRVWQAEARKRAEAGMQAGGLWALRINEATLMGAKMRDRADTEWPIMMRKTRIPPVWRKGGAQMNEAAATAVPGAARSLRVKCAGKKVTIPRGGPWLISDGAGVYNDKQTHDAVALGADALGAMHTDEGLVELDVVHLKGVRRGMAHGTL